MARAGELERAVLHGQVPEHPTPQAAGAPYFAMDAGEDEGEAPAAGRPAKLLEVLPQERIQRRTVEQIVDPVPVVPLLHDVEPQMVEQLVDILSLLDSHVAEQVIEVPKIECPPRAARTVLRAPQTVEQLVEVPTLVSYSSLFQRTVEQNVDNPVAGGSGAGGGLSGFLSGQNSAALWNRSVDILSGGGLQGFQRGQSSTAFMEQITVSPNPGRGLQIFQPVQGSAASSSVSPGHAGEGGFSHFSQDEKSATLLARSWSALPPHSSPWTPSAYDVPMVLEEEEESELDEAEEGDEVASMVEYVECDGRWWGNSGTRRRNGFAVGSLRLMALSSVTPSGALRGSLVDVFVTILDKFQQSWYLLWSSSPCRMCSGTWFLSSTE